MGERGVWKRFDLFFFYFKIFFNLIYFFLNFLFDLFFKKKKCVCEFYSFWQIELIGVVLGFNENVSKNTPVWPLNFKSIFDIFTNDSVLCIFWFLSQIQWSVSTHILTKKLLNFECEILMRDIWGREVCVKEIWFIFILKYF